MTKTQNTPCPCQSSLTYTLCCGKYHKGKIHAPTAETLMRSRYCAYVIGDAQYLYRTWHESTRPSLQSLRASGAQKSLLSLKILSTIAGKEKDNKGTVKFITSSNSATLMGDIDQHKENSLFVKLKDRWIYIDAV